MISSLLVQPWPEYELWLPRLLSDAYLPGGLRKEEDILLYFSKPLCRKLVEITLQMISSVLT